MYIKGQNQASVGPLPTHAKNHHKPYLLRHLGLFCVGLLIIAASVFAVGYYFGQTQLPLAGYTGGQVKAANSTSAQEALTSDLGFSLVYDKQQFVTEQTSTEVSLKPKNSIIDGPAQLSRLSIQPGILKPKTDRFFEVKQLSQTSDQIGGEEFQKTVYIHQPKFKAAAKSLFSVVWSKQTPRPMTVTIENLPSSIGIPAVYGQILANLQFDGKDRRVLAQTTASTDVNVASPAVVKLYHFVCGTLVLNDVRYAEDACDGGVGSGFLISSNGYIATSGHVVSLTPADIVVSGLMSNPLLLRQFTLASGLTADQAANPAVVAASLAKIYDLPKEKLRLDNQRKIIIAALGDRPAPAASQEEIKELFNTPDSDFHKRAEIKAINYESKDLLSIEQPNEDGFSASDVALLKINADNTPYITLANSNKIQQNQAVTLVGFPADADNQLTTNSVITPTVTNGHIGAIRQANGSTSRLYQTDADASEGSSGGPALNVAGEAFGLVTYRFKAGNEANAAKSYVRDISDLKELVEANKINLPLGGSTQVDWRAGLSFFNEEKYSKAANKFLSVLQSYPAHRLANNYLAKAQQAIREGKDKKDPPYLLIGIITSGTGGILILAFAIWRIIHHRRDHLSYKKAHYKQHLVTPNSPV